VLINSYQLHFLSLGHIFISSTSQIYSLDYWWQLDDNSSATMNAAPNVFVLMEPLFYDEKVRTQGCTTKEFVNRIETQRQSTGWDQQMTTTRACGFMWDAAHLWCEHTLPAIFQWEPERMTAIWETWDRFWGVFQANYFTVNSATDLAVNWMTLRQLPAEDALMFANQVASMLHKYQDLLIAHLHPVAQRQWLSDAIEVLHMADANSGSRAQEAEVTRTMEALMETCQAHGRELVIMDIII
jgi:hypothetical protein